LTFYFSESYDWHFISMKVLISYGRNAFAKKILVITVLPHALSKSLSSIALSAFYFPFLIIL